MHYARYSGKRPCVVRPPSPIRLGVPPQTSASGSPAPRDQRKYQSVTGCFLHNQPDQPPPHDTPPQTIGDGFITASGRSTDDAFWYVVDSLDRPREREREGVPRAAVGRPRACRLPAQYAGGERAACGMVGVEYRVSCASDTSKQSDWSTYLGFCLFALSVILGELSLRSVLGFCVFVLLADAVRLCRACIGPRTSPMPRSQTQGRAQAPPRHAPTSAAS